MEKIGIGKRSFEDVIAAFKGMGKASIEAVDQWTYLQPIFEQAWLKLKEQEKKEVLIYTTTQENEKAT